MKQIINDILLVICIYFNWLPMHCMASESSIEIISQEDSHDDIQDKSNLLVPTGNLDIKITNVKKIKGFVRIAVFADQNSWLKQSKLSKVLPVNSESCVEKVCQWQIEGVPFGDYGIAVFHDENGNEELDTNFLGIPKEAFGFSNNRSAMFGPPSWKKSKFALDTTNAEHVISL